MGSRAADVQFLLPAEPTSLLLIQQSAVRAAALAEGGVQVYTPGRAPGGSFSAVLTSSGALGLALAYETSAMLIEGRLSAAWRSRLAGAGWTLRSYLRVGPADTPTAFLPANRSGRLLAAPLEPWRGWTTVAGLRSGLRRVALRAPVGEAIANVTVGTRGPRPPGLVERSARHLGWAGPVTWWWDLGRGHHERRVALFLSPAGCRSARWVVKIDRGGERDRSAQERAVLAALRTRAPELAARAPRGRGAVSWAGSVGSIEDAVPGRLLERLAHERPAAALATGAQVLAWACRLIAATAVSPRSPAATDASRAEDASADADRTGAALAAQLARAQVCVTHGDLCTGNVLVDRGSFGVIDWEHGAAYGVPVWDVAALVSDLLLQSSGPHVDADRVRWIARLWAGELPESAWAFRWFDAAAKASGMTTRQAAAAVTLGWWRRSGWRDPTSGCVVGDYQALVADAWRSHPKLGLEWTGPAP